MAWIFTVFSAMASYQTDQNKLQICEELSKYWRNLGVQTCFRQPMKMTSRGTAIDFRWRLGKNLVCQGTFYTDNGDTVIDGCWQ